MSLRILKAGVLTTIQDTGRIHYRHIGINPGGAMDMYAARVTNLLVGNPDRSGVLEVHFPADSLLFEKDAWIALGGADFHPVLDERQRIDLWRLHFVKEGSILSFPRWHFGRCLYLAVHGGFDIPSWLGSQSTHIQAEAGGFQGRKLQTGDRIFFAESQVHFKALAASFKEGCFCVPWYPSDSFTRSYLHTTTVRILPGAEWHYLTRSSQQQLVSQPFAIGLQNNRIGYRLAGAPLALQQPIECISSAVTTGTLQLLPDGQLIVLMADAQTTGGYPRMGSVLSTDIPILAQKGSQEAICFSIISQEQAEELVIQREKSLRLLAYAIHQKIRHLSLV